MPTPDRTSSHANHREREILDELRLAGGASRIQFLAERLNVSEETIRRNIRVLEDGGHVTKVHGGVHLNRPTDEAPLSLRMTENAEAKRLIAAEVAGMIENGDSLFLDIGSTTAFIATALERHHELLVVTNSISVAQALATRNGNRVFLAGGALRPHDGGAFGIEAVDYIRRFRVRHAIFSVAAIGAEGFMLRDAEEAEFSRHAGRIADNRMIVADASKFGQAAPFMVDMPSMLVTNAAPPEQVGAMLDRGGIRTVVAGGR